MVREPKGPSKQEQLKSKLQELQQLLADLSHENVDIKKARFIQLSADIAALQ